MLPCQALAGGNSQQPDWTKVKEVLSAQARMHKTNLNFKIFYMPYIPQKDRKQLDPIIDQLAEKINTLSREQKYEAAFAGLLNYTCTRLALKIIRLRFGKARYWIIAAVTGVFKNVSDEFYRRLSAPYEDKQITKNGDVDLYAEYQKEISNL